MSQIPTNAKPKKLTKYSQIANGIYTARLTRVVGYGMQKQPDWNNEKKADAFKVALTYELYDPTTGKPLDVSGYEYTLNERDEEVKVPDSDLTRPSCVFQDMFFFPGAKRGKVFDLCKALDASIEKVPADFDWFVEKLGSPVQLTVAQWTSKAGNKGVGVNAVNGVPTMIANALEPARTDLVSFFPYLETDVNDRGYAKMYPFQRTVLTEASDSANIPYAGKDPKVFDEEETKPHANTDKVESPETEEQSTDDDRPF